MAAIATEEAKEIVRLRKEEGKLRLAQLMSLEIEDEDDMRNSIKIDFLYDSLTFAIERGFSYTHTCLLFKMVHDLLEESIGRPLSETVQMYRTKTQALQDKVNERTLSVFTEYIFNTFMKHYKLYQYVFTHARGVDQRCCNLTVEGATEPLPFCEGKEKKVWNYEQKMAEIQRKEDESKHELIKKKTDYIPKYEESLNSSYLKVDSLQTPPNKESIRQLIKEVTSAHVEKLDHTLRTSIDETIHDLEFKLEKTSLPRPQALGPPARYGLKSGSRAKSPSGPKTNNDRKSASRSAKSRGSKK